MNNPSRTEESLARLVGIAQDQLRWQRAAVLPAVRRTIDQTLVTKKYRQAYEMLDGTRAGREVAKAVGVSEGAVSRWASRWRNLGIAYETTDENGAKRTKHLVSLDDLDLPIDVDDA
jgi:predicted transcriptional regulator